MSGGHAECNPPPQVPSCLPSDMDASESDSDEDRRFWDKSRHSGRQNQTGAGRSQQQRLGSDGAKVTGAAIARMKDPDAEPRGQLGSHCSSPGVARVHVEAGRISFLPRSLTSKPASSPRLKHETENAVEQRPDCRMRIPHATGPVRLQKKPGADGAGGRGAEPVREPTLTLRGRRRGRTGVF